LPARSAPRFVLARFALLSQPPRPDEALTHLRASEQLQREAEACKSCTPAESAKQLPPRWRGGGSRSAGAEGQSKRGQAVLDRMATGNRGSGGGRCRHAAAEVHRRRPGPRPVRAGGACQYGGACPASPASLSITDARGLLDFLSLATGLAADKQQALERGGLMLSAWETMTGGTKPSEKVLREVCDRACPVPRPVRYATHSWQTAALADWTGLYGRLDRLLERTRVAGRHRSTHAPVSAWPGTPRGGAAWMRPSVSPARLEGDRGQAPAGGPCAGARTPRRGRPGPWCSRENSSR